MWFDALLSVGVASTLDGREPMYTHLDGTAG